MGKRGGAAFPAPAIWSPDEPQTVDPALTPELVEVLIAALESQGLVMLVVIAYPNGYQASMLGRLLIARATATAAA
jgi:hypothetical protein